MSCILAELDQTRREQFEIKDQFTSRSPLATQLQFTASLVEGRAREINRERRHCLEIGLRNSRQLRDMINDFLKVTRAEGGQFGCPPKPFARCEVFRPILQSHARSTADKRTLSACNRLTRGLRSVATLGNSLSTPGVEKRKQYRLK